jgi:uncharacterized membrane protein
MNRQVGVCITQSVRNPRISSACKLYTFYYFYIVVLSVSVCPKIWMNYNFISFCLIFSYIYNIKIKYKQTGQEHHQALDRIICLLCVYICHYIFPFFLFGHYFINLLILNGRTTTKHAWIKSMLLRWTFPPT